MFNLVFHLTSLEDKKWQNWHPASAFILYLPICMKFVKSYGTDITTLYVFQQDVRAYAGNFTYALRLQMIVGNRLNDTKCPNKEFFLVRIFLYSVRIQENMDYKKLRIWSLFTQCISIWKKLRKIDFASDGHYWEGGSNFKFSSVKEFKLWWHNFLPKCWNMITLTF